MKYTKSDFPDLNYKQRKEKELEDLRVASGVRYTGIDARDSFYYAVERIKWLNGKIEQRKRDGLPHFLYMRERDCLFWMMDKVKELSEKLIERDKEIHSLRDQLDNYIENTIDNIQVTVMPG